ncbi:hypothetical protein [uncultured Lentibacter sp.]|jgi:hypothetical protein|uniref:hypothetical protein n=1 Tax=uncultured Lentibacter sp. TaxID=1659309 RepID=UPI00260DF403|nr:hypothetical protein [uncultured Lentibacter sp.]
MTLKNFKSVLLPAACALAPLAAFSERATAQTAANCAPREAVLARLAERYGETRQSVGLGANNAMVEVFASADSGTWTILVTTAQGLSCLVASGQAYEALAEALPARENDA